MPKPKRRPAKRWSLRRLSLPRWLLAAVAVVGVGLVALALHANHEISTFLADRSFPPIRIYSAPFVLRPGVDVGGAKLFERLGRLGFTETETDAVSPGQFSRREGTISLGLRPFPDVGGEVEVAPVRLAVEDGVIRSIRRIGDREPVPRALLEPELVGTYSGGVTGGRQPVVLADLPEHLVHAVIAAEDAWFFSHPGIDPVGLLRATWVNLRGGTVRQGGSTITQQLAKNLFLSPERSIGRKLHEALYALLLEIRLSKEEILESYLNTIYLGRVGSIGIYGFGAAARAFFGKAARDLDVGEAATLAGVIPSPNTDSPVRHPKRALVRRNLVLAAMHDNGWIDEALLAAAKAKPLGVSTQAVRPLEAAFFVDEVLRRVGELGHSPFLVRGLSVYTTVDLEIQRAAERAVRGGLVDLEKRHPRLAKKEGFEAAAVVLDAESGFTRAMVGGRDFSSSQYNRATRAQRQPGSAFKPFVYLAAIDAADAHVTPITHVRDEPIELRVGDKVWKPTNYDDEFLGEVTVRRALEGSRNVPTVNLAREIGFDRVVDLARASGLGPVPYLPAVVLGSAEVSLVDLAGAYTVFPKQGEVVRPALIRAVLGSKGEVLYQDQMRSRRVATSAAAYVVSSMLEGVVNRGTAASLRRLGVRRPVAGKTGTTNEAKDSWFVGYSPELVAGVWVGFDDGSPVGLTGSTGALPIWALLMKDVLDAYAPRPFPIPDGVIFRDVDPRTGRLGGFLCPDTVREAFVVGTEPTIGCNDPFGEEPLSDPRLDARRAPDPRREPPPWPEEEPTPLGQRPSGWNGVESWFKGVFGGR